MPRVARDCVLLRVPELPTASAGGITSNARWPAPQEGKNAPRSARNSARAPARRSLPGAQRAGRPARPTGQYYAFLARPAAPLLAPRHRVVGGVLSAAPGRLVVTPWAPARE